MSMPLIEAHSVSKHFGRFRVLENVNLAIAPDDFIGILGKNGAGKTTLLKIIASLLKPSGGTVFFNGMNLRDHLNEVLRQIGMISHQTYLYGDLTAIENLRFYAKLYDVNESEAALLLEKVGLTKRADESVRRFSRGMQQRLSIARMLLHRPKVLLLDEPYTGLDPKASQFLDDILIDYHRNGNCIIMVSHDLDHCLRMAKRAVVLDKGTIVLDSAIDTLALSELKNTIMKHYMA